MASETWALFALTALVFLSRVLFIYYRGMPEADSMMVAAGVALGATGSMPFGETLLYGRQLNPGVFLFMRATFPFLWRHPADVVALLNGSSVVLGTLTLLPAYNLFRIHLSARVALASLAIWAFTPIVWEAQTYFHPMVPATFLFLLSLDCSRRVNRTATGILWLAMTAFLAAAAFLSRVEVAFVLPAVLFIAAASERRAKHLGVLAAVCVAVAITYWLVMASISTEASSTISGVSNFAMRWNEMYGRSLSLRGLPRSLAWATLGLGFVSLAVCVMGLARGLLGSKERRAERRLVVFGIIWALPSLLFWLPYIVPILRHYYVATLAIAWMVGLVALKRLGGRRLVGIAVSIVALNLLVPEGLYRIVNAARPTPKTAHGSFFYYHEQTAPRVHELADLREAVVSCPAPGGAGTVAPRSLILCRWDAYANATYAIAARGRSVQIESNEMIAPQVRLVRYVCDGGEVRLINYIYLDDPRSQQAVSQQVAQALNDGFCVFIPESVRDRLSDVEADAVNVNYYR